MNLIAAHVAPFAMDDVDKWGSWLYHAEEFEDTKFFAIIELNGRGMDLYRPLTERLREIAGDWWTYSVDTGRMDVHQPDFWHNTLRQQLAMGLMQQYATLINACKATVTFPDHQIFPDQLVSTQ